MYDGKDTMNNSLAEEAEKYFVENKNNSTSEIVKCATKYIAARKEVKTFEAKKPLKPVETNAAKESFSIDVESEEFPEIAVYKDVLFEIANTKKLNQADANIDWSDVVLKRITKSDNYNVKFISETKTVDYVVLPVFEGKSYENAKKLFASKFESYEVKLNQKKEDEKIAEQKLKVELKRQKQEQEKLLKEYATQRVADSLEYLKQPAIAEKQQKVAMAKYKQQFEEEYLKKNTRNNLKKNTRKQMY